MHALCVAFVRVCVVCVRACVRACARVGCCGCVLKGQLRSGCGKEHEAPRSLAYRDASAILAAGYPCYPPSNEAPTWALQSPSCRPPTPCPSSFRSAGAGTRACSHGTHACIQMLICVHACVRARRANGTYTAGGQEHHYPLCGAHGAAGASCVT